MEIYKSKVGVFYLIYMKRVHQKCTCKYMKHVHETCTRRHMKHVHVDMKRVHVNI